VEYFPPFALIFAAFAWTPLLRDQPGLDPVSVSRSSRPSLAPILLSLAIGLSISLSIPRAREAIDRSKPYNLYAGASAWLAEHARPDDIVISDEHALLDLYLTRKAGWEQARSLEESLVDEKKRWNFVRDRHEVWVVLKASRLGAAYGAELEAWLDEHFVETTRLGPAPPPLTVHDNRLVVLQRKARVTDNK